MPSYVVRDTITQRTANKLVGKFIRISMINSDNSLYDIGPICNIHPIKDTNKKYALLFYLSDDNTMKWCLYNYEQIEIPKNPDTNIYILIIKYIVNEGSVPVKIIFEK